MKRFMRMPSPAMVVACLALFVALSGVSYAVATIGSNDIINGSIRNRDFKDGTLRGNESKPDGFGPNAIKEQSLDSSKFNAAKIGKVTASSVADGITRHGVISSAGAAVRWLRVERSMRNKAPLPLPLIVPLLAGAGALAAAVVLVFILWR